MIVIGKGQGTSNCNLNLPSSPSSSGSNLMANSPNSGRNSSQGLSSGRLVTPLKLAAMLKNDGVSPQNHSKGGAFSVPQAHQEKHQQVLEIIMKQPSNLNTSKKQSIQRCSLETGGATQHDPSNPIEELSADQSKFPQVMVDGTDLEAGGISYGGGKGRNALDEIDAVNSFFFKQQMDQEERRVFHNPGRVLDLYKRSFNNKKSTQFFSSSNIQKKPSVPEVIQHFPPPPSNNGLSSPVNFDPQQPRSKTPNTFVVGRKNSRSFTRFIPKQQSQHMKGMSAGVSYPSNQHSNSAKGETFAVSQKFPKRSMPPHRQSLLLTKRSSISGQQNSQLKSRRQLNSDINGLDVNNNPLTVQKKNLEHNASIKSGRYDTLKAINASEASKSVSRQDFSANNKVIRQPKVKMQPIGRVNKGGLAVEGFKSTLSNTSFINKISSFKDISKAVDPVPDSASASSSDNQLNKWPSNPFNSQDASNDVAISDKNQKMLEIKGEDGDKVMILQFDNKQLQVFNDILERQILKAKEEAASTSNEGDKETNKGSSQDRSNLDRAKSSPSGSNSNEVKANSGITAPRSQQVRNRAYTRHVPAAQRKALLSQANDLHYIIESPQRGIKQLLGFDSQRGSKSGSYHDRTISPGFSPQVSQKASSFGKTGNKKKPVDLSNFIKSWQEESRLSSPGLYDSPKHKFYLHAAMYHNQKRASESSQRIVFSRGEDTETTLNATGGISEFDRQRALSHPEAKGIPVKEFKVDIRKPSNNVKKDQSTDNQPQPRHMHSTDTFCGQTTVRQVASNMTKNTKKPQSFLQTLTKKFGPSLVSEYLMTKNLSAMRRLIKLEQSQHCDCLFRQQMKELQLFEQQEKQPSNIRSYDKTMLHTKKTPLSKQSHTGVIQTQTSPREKETDEVIQLDQPSKPDEAVDEVVIHETVAESRKTSNATPQPQINQEDIQHVVTASSTQNRGPPEITATPCKNCLTQSNFADLLCKVYQRQVQQKLMPVHSNQISAQPHVQRINMNMVSPRDVKQGRNTATKNLLHHTRYYKKEIEPKEVRDLKKQHFLRMARNSKVLKVTPMNNLKSFDKHIQRCLTVKNDSVLHRAEMQRSDAEGGLAYNTGSMIYQSMLSDELTPDMSNSIISNVGGEQIEDNNTSKAGSVTQKGNTTYYTRRVSSTDVPGVRIINNETSSTPSLSPPPIMVLNPRQDQVVGGGQKQRKQTSANRQTEDDTTEQEEQRNSNKSKSSINKKSQKFFFFKGRNYSTLTRQHEQVSNQQYAPIAQASATNSSMRDQLSRVLGNTKGSHQLGVSQGQRSGTADSNDDASGPANAKRTSVISNQPNKLLASQVNKNFASSSMTGSQVTQLVAEQQQHQQQQMNTDYDFSNSAALSQLRAAAAMRNGSAAATHTNYLRTTNQNNQHQKQPNAINAIRMAPIPASTHQLNTKPDRKIQLGETNLDNPGSCNFKKEINSVLQENNFNYYRTNRISSSYKPAQKQNQSHQQSTSSPKNQNNLPGAPGGGNSASPNSRNFLQPFVKSTRVTTTNGAGPEVIFSEEQPAPSRTSIQHLSPKLERQADTKPSPAKEQEDGNHDVTQVNFSTSKHVPQELAKFFRYARKSALKLGSFDQQASNGHKNQTGGTTPHYMPNTATTSSLFAQAADFHRNGGGQGGFVDEQRRGLKTSENQMRASKTKQRADGNAAGALPGPVNNTRYCVTRQRSRQRASMVFNPSSSNSSVLIRQILHDQTRNNKNATAAPTENDKQDHADQRTNKSCIDSMRKQRKLEGGRDQKTHKIPSVRSPRSLASTHRNSRETAEPIQFKALKPTILTPSSALSTNQQANIKLIVSRDAANKGSRSTTERCVKVNSRHIVVKDQPRQIPQMLYSSFCSSEKQEKFHITDPNCGFFR